jgi:hypothetical protein
MASDLARTLAALRVLACWETGRRPPILLPQPLFFFPRGKGGLEGDRVVACRWQVSLCPRESWSQVRACGVACDAHEQRRRGRWGAKKLGKLAKAWNGVSEPLTASRPVCVHGFSLSRACAAAFLFGRRAGPDGTVTRRPVSERRVCEGNYKLAGGTLLCSAGREGRI